MPIFRADIVDGTLQKTCKLRLFFLRKALNDAAFVFPDRRVHPLVTRHPRVGNDDALAAAVIGIGFQFQKVLLLQTGQQARHSGMGQMKLCLQVLGVGGLLSPVGQKGHEPPLRRGQAHIVQRFRHGLITAPVQNPHQVSVMYTQCNHPQNYVASYILAGLTKLFKWFCKMFTIISHLHERNRLRTYYLRGDVR